MRSSDNSCRALVLTSLLVTVGAFSQQRQQQQPILDVATLPEASASMKATELDRLEECQTRSAQISASFEPRTFTPWIKNRHLQTILSVFLRMEPDCDYVTSPNDTLQTMVKKLSNSKSSLPPLGETYWDKRERIETPDGDWFHVDSKLQPSEKASNGLMIIMHGLESNSESNLSVDMARAYFDLGLDVSCIIFRSCSGQINDTPGAYHVGFTQDVKQYLDTVTSEGADRPIYLSGFSLGGNAMIKTLGELQAEAIDKYNIRGAVAFCPPLDCEKNSVVLAGGGVNRIAYTNTLLKSLKQKAQENLDRYYDGDEEACIFDYQGAVNCKTIFEFDDAFIAPIYGFDSAVDYYQKCSSIYFLETVAVPLMVLNAKDDPFTDPSVWPIEKTREYGGKSPAKLVFSDYGGHCGFMFHQPGDEEKQPLPGVSWGPAEMARFIRHVMVTDKRMDLAKMGFGLQLPPL